MDSKIELRLTIDYDAESKTIHKYEIADEYTLGEIAVIEATFKQCLKDWGYDVKLKMEE